MIINRNLPVNPPTLILPAGTTVYIRLDDPHWDETIAFNNALVHTVPQDVAADVLKSFASPLSGVVGAVTNTATTPQISFQAYVFRDPSLQASPDEIPSDTDIVTLQNRAKDLFDKALPPIQKASIALACYETYRGVITENGQPVCDATAPLIPASASQAYADLNKTIDAATINPLPSGELGAADALLKTELFGLSTDDR